MEANRRGPDGNGFAALALAFIAGGLAGAACGLLFAPRSGEETRDRLRVRTEGARERMGDVFRTMRVRAEELSETGKEKIEGVSEKVLGFVDRMIEKIFPGVDEGNVQDR